MQYVFEEVNSLDRRCYEEYGLSEDLLMEHAASSMLNFINDNFKSNSKILIVAGAGNNGADGIALARLMQGNYKVKLYLPFGVHTEIGKLQLKRAEFVGVKIVNKIKKADIVVDCLFGTGLNRDLTEKAINIITQLNELKSYYKIACDIPSGINNIGQVNQIAFKADTTITMGALKKSLYTDEAKNFTGEIKVANLGIQRELYETKSLCNLLDVDDLKLPFREAMSTHKGDFGHLAVVVGQKDGAGLIACESAFSFGVGLITAITKHTNIPKSIMSSLELPDNTSAIAIGMGLGDDYDKTILQNDIAKVIDADMFYDDEVLNLLDKENIVLTPHPKEFVNLLKLTNIADISVSELQQNRFKYLSIFCSKFPNTVLLLKGSNVLIGQNDKIFINPLGSSALSFGGSGDILSGLIGSLLAQRYNSLEAAINGSLTHTIAALNYDKNDYSMTPNDLINEIKSI